MEGASLVKKKEILFQKRLLLKVSLCHLPQGEKKRVLQGGFAELEGIIWTSLLAIICFSFIQIQNHIEKDTINHIKGFENEWNKIKI